MILSNWRESTIGNEIDLLYGKSLPKSDRSKGSIPVYGSNGIVGFHNKFAVDGPGIIVGRKGSIGEVAFSLCSFWPIDTTYFVRNKGGLNWHFLFYLLSSLGLERLNSHSAIPGLNRESAYALPCAIPPRPEQERIAAVLWKVQQAIEVEDKLIATVRELKKSAMRQLFTRGFRGEAQKETDIGPVPVSWDVIPLGKHLTAAQYGLSVRGHETGRYPILRMNCQLDGQVVFRDLQFVDLDQKTFAAFRVNDGDLLFNRTNSFELVGRTAIFRSARDAVFASYLIRLTLDQNAFHPEFVNYFLNQPNVQADLKRLASRGVSQANINATKLREFAVPQTGLEEQRDIISVLLAIDRKISVHERKRAILQELFKTLLHQLMTGEIRVNNLDIDVSEVAAL